jgi:hypothetical protein
MEYMHWNAGNARAAVVQWKKGPIASATAASNVLLGASEMDVCAALFIQGPESHYCAHVRPDASIRDIEGNLPQEGPAVRGNALHIIPGIRDRTREVIYNIVSALALHDGEAPSRIQYHHFPPHLVGGIDRLRDVGWPVVYSQHGLLFARPDDVQPPTDPIDW